MDVVIFRWIMTSKIGTKIVATRCVSYFLGSTYAKNAFAAAGGAYSASSDL